MEDLNEKLNRLLSSPDGMAKLRSAMAAFGESGGVSDAPSSPPPPTSGDSEAGGGMPDLKLLTKLAPLMGAMDKDDDDTRLLQALRPYLHGEREQRLDETMRLLKLMRLLPLLQETGALGTGSKTHGREAR